MIESAPEIKCEGVSMLIHIKNTMLLKNINIQDLIFYPFLLF